VLFPGADALTSGLTLPATAAELWMIGYLLIVGVRRFTYAPTSAAVIPVATK